MELGSPRFAWRFAPLALRADPCGPAGRGYSGQDLQTPERSDTHLLRTERWPSLDRAVRSFSFVPVRSWRNW
jgi:hypothetical protein